VTSELPKFLCLDSGVWNRPSHRHYSAWLFETTQTAVQSTFSAIAGLLVNEMYLVMTQFRLIA